MEKTLHTMICEVYSSVGDELRIYPLSFLLCSQLYFNMLIPKNCLANQIILNSRFQAEFFNPPSHHHKNDNFFVNKFRMEIHVLN